MTARDRVGAPPQHRAEIDAGGSAAGGDHASKVPRSKLSVEERSL